MRYFLETSETIEQGVGFSHFGLIHLLWIFAFIVFGGICCYVYVSSNKERRLKIRKII